MRRATAAALCAGGTLLAACSHERGHAPPPSASEAPPAPVAISMVRVGPISFFQQACARCHGAYGSMYDDGFATRRTDDDLARTVRDMVTGPAQASLDSRSMAALFAYHRSLADGLPFLAITRADRDTIEGEATPGSSVTLHAGAASIPVPIEGHAWRARLDHPGPHPSEVEARIGDRVTRLILGPVPFSHSQPGR